MAKIYVVMIQNGKPIIKEQYGKELKYRIKLSAYGRYTRPDYYDYHAEIRIVQHNDDDEEMINKAKQIVNEAFELLNTEPLPSSVEEFIKWFIETINKYFEPYNLHDIEGDFKQMGGDYPAFEVNLIFYD